MWIDNGKTITLSIAGGVFNPERKNITTPLL